MSIAIDAARAIVAELNAGEFSQEFVAKMKLIPAYELSELRELKVTVVPKLIEVSPASRASTQLRVKVDIGIQKRISKNLISDCQALLKLADEILTFLRKRKLQDAPEFVYAEAQNDPLYDPGLLEEKRTFTGVITLTYLVLR